MNISNGDHELELVASWRSKKKISLRLGGGGGGKKRFFKGHPQALVDL